MELVILAVSLYFIVQFVIFLLSTVTGTAIFVVFCSIIIGTVLFSIGCKLGRKG